LPESLKQLFFKLSFLINQIIFQDFFYHLTLQEVSVKFEIEKKTYQVRKKRSVEACFGRLFHFASTEIKLFEKSLKIISYNWKF